MSDQAPVRHLADPAPQTHGGRVELRLLDSDGNASARYEALYFVGGRRLVGELQAEAGPPARVSAISLDPVTPAWLVEFSITLLRTTTRSARTNGFPRRLTRWRPGSGDAGEE